MNTNDFLTELRTAMRDSTDRTLLDKDWYLKQFTLSTGEKCGFIARMDGKYRAYVYIPANIVPGVSWGQAVVLESAGKGKDHFVGEVCPVVYHDNNQWLLAIPKKNPSRIATWGHQVLEASRFSADVASIDYQKVKPLGKLFSNTAVITGWYANAQKNLVANGGLIKSSIFVADHLLEGYDWISIVKYIGKSPEAMTIATLAKAKVAGIIDF